VSYVVFNPKVSGNNEANNGLGLAPFVSKPKPKPKKSKGPNNQKGKGKKP
jgi:hypothetical protein